MTVLDRLRIERATWTVDARLQDLPRRSRITKRRELRENLRAASIDVGARQAVRRLGDLRILAAEYVTAEYGDLTPRPSWTAAALAIALLELFMLALGNVATSVFQAGVIATNPHVTGTFRWHGIPYLVSDQTFTYLDGRSTSVGGAWTALVYAIILAAAIIAGRLWRLLPAARHRRILTSAA